MSHIFDALQRSEAERAAAEPSSRKNPEFSITTELLQMVEPKRKKTAPPPKPVAPPRVLNRELLSRDVRDNGVLSREQTGIERMSREETTRVETTRVVMDSAAAEREFPSRAPVPTRDYVPALEPLDIGELATGPDTSQPLEQFPSLTPNIRPSSRLVSVGAQESLGAEKFRFLAVRLRQMRQTRLLKTVLITSTIPQEGKSTVAANLACTMARRKQHRTLLFEGDLRRPTVADRLGLGNVPGVCEWLRGETSSLNVYRLPALGLWVLPAGRAPENPLELMQPERLTLLFDQLTPLFDWIILDAPPVLPLADTSIWARMADGILLVTRKGVTEKRQLQRGIEALEPTKLLGALVNGSTDAAHSDYYQRYGPATEASPRFGK